MASSLLCLQERLLITTFLKSIPGGISFWILRLTGSSYPWLYPVKNDGLLGLVMPIQREAAPLDSHSTLGGIQSFRFLWDRAPSFYLSAIGRAKVCMYFDLFYFN
jgi:hypothetical protein